MRPHCFILTVLTKVYSCRLELAYFAGKISKNRLVCKNAVALAYYGSCRLLVMGSCHEIQVPKCLRASPKLRILLSADNDAWNFNRSIITPVSTPSSYISGHVHIVRYSTSLKYFINRDQIYLKNV